MNVSIESSVRQALADGGKLEAIKVYRQLTNASLKESKDAVEVMAAGGLLPLPVHSEATPMTMDADGLQLIHQALAEGNKIEAIKLYRILTGLGLKEALEAVEALQGSGAPITPAAEAQTPITADGLSRVRQAIASGRKIEAIKLYREYTAVGLKEAKDIVEAIAAGQELPYSAPVVPTIDSPPAQPMELTSTGLAQVRMALAGGNKIEAIKVYRTLTGLGLKEAKDAVDALMTSGTLPDSPGEKPGPTQATRPTGESQIEVPPLVTIESGPSWLLMAGLGLIFLVVIGVAALLLLQ